MHRVWPKLVFAVIFHHRTCMWLQINSISLILITRLEACAASVEVELSSLQLLLFLLCSAFPFCQSNRLSIGNPDMQTITSNLTFSFSLVVSLSLSLYMTICLSLPSPLPPSHLSLFVPSCFVLRWVKEREETCLQLTDKMLVSRCPLERASVWVCVCVCDFRHPFI